MLSRTIPLVLLLAVLIINPSFASEENPVLAKAGDYVISQKDFDRLVSFSPPSFKEQLERNPQQKIMIITKIMEQKIIAGLARERGLDKHEDTEVQMQYLVNDLLSREYLIKVVKKSVSVTDEDTKQYYEDNRTKYTTPEGVTARHILISVPFGATDEEAGKAEEKAKNILQRLDKGEKFETLAEKHSEDETSSQKGGDLGYIPRGRMSKTFEEAAFSLKPGEISDPVRTSLGYHIIYIKDRRKESTKTFEEVKEAIKKQLQDEREQAAVREFITRASEDAGLEVYTDRIIDSEEDKQE